MNEEELMRMVVRLIGDTESFQEMFLAASEQAEKLKESVKGAYQAEKMMTEAQKKGAEVTKQVEKSSEKYAREIDELKTLLKDGAISQETFARASAKAEKELNELNSSLIYANRVTDLAETAAEKYSAEVYKLASVQKSGYITAQTYARSIDKAKKEFLSAHPAIKLVESSTEKYEREVKDLTQALNLGVITQKQYNSSLRDSNTAYRQAGNAATQYGQSIKSIGQSGFMRVTLPVLGMGIAATAAGVDIQSAFAGVRKTVDVTEDRLQGLKSEFENFITSGNAPFDITELLGTAETAGQLGIDFDNIVDFTKTVENLKLSSNLADEAGESLARIANITGLPQTEFSNLGSTIVALGNTTATTERDIVNMIMRLSGAGRQIGMTVPQIAALGASLSSVGIEAEAGGTAFSQLFLNLSKQIALGGNELESFASTAGLTVDEFSTLFKKDASQAIQVLLRGLNEMEGSQAIIALDEMGIAGARLTDSLLRSSAAVDLMEDAMNTAETAYKENTALTKEASVRYTSFSGVLKNARAQFKLMGEDIFEVLEPALRAGIELIAKFTKSFRELDSTSKFWIVTAAMVAAAIPPLLIGLGSLLVMGGSVALMLTTITTGTIAFSTASGAATLTVGTLTIGIGALATSIGIAGAALAGIGLAAWAAYELGQAIFGVNEFNRQLKESQRLADKMSEVRSKQNTEVNIEIDTIGDPAEKIEFLKEALDMAEKNANGLSNSVGGAKKRVEELSTIWNTATGNKLLAEAEDELKQVSSASTQASERVQELRMKLEALNGQEVEISVEESLESSINKMEEFSIEIDKVVQSFETELSSIGVTEREHKIQSLEIELKGMEKAGQDVTAIQDQIETLRSLDVAIEIKTRLQQNEENVTSRIESIQRSIETTGMSDIEIELFDLKSLDVAPEKIEEIKTLLTTLKEETQFEESKKQADALTERFLPPEDKLEKRKVELQTLLDQGLIDESTFDSALKEAKESLGLLEDQTNKDYKVDLGVKGIDTVEAGSAEAMARINEFLQTRDSFDSTSPDSPPTDQFTETATEAEVFTNYIEEVTPQMTTADLSSTQDPLEDIRREVTLLIRDSTLQDVQGSSDQVAQTTQLTSSVIESLSFTESTSNAQEIIDSTDRNSIESIFTSSESTLGESISNSIDTITVSETTRLVQDSLLTSSSSNITEDTSQFSRTNSVDELTNQVLTISNITEPVEMFLPDLEQIVERVIVSKDSIEDLNQSVSVSNEPDLTQPEQRATQVMSGSFQNEASRDNEALSRIAAGVEKLVSVTEGRPIIEFETTDL
jgi:TP901 family phage tail tape measure protein